MAHSRKFLTLITTTILITLSFAAGSPSSAKNILFYFPLGSYSHRIPVWPLVTYLADQGHQVTFLSSFHPKQPHPNVTELVPPEFLQILEEEGETSVVEMRRAGFAAWTSWALLDDLGLNFCEAFLSKKENQEWINKSKFDLIVMDGLFNDCALALVHKYKAKLITYATSAPCMWQIDSFGLVPESNWIPDMQYYFPLNMNIMERLGTAFNTLYWHLLREYDYLPKLTELARKHLDLPDLPPLGDIEKNVSLVLLNSHFSEEFARSLPPHVIPVGGMHIQDKRKPLIKEIDDFITKGGDKGFVYISFGSYFQLSKEPPEVFEAIMSVIKKIDLHFLWKYEGGVPSNIPSNLLMQKWISQQDVLAHPKIKAFVTHSGLMSITEAIYHGVPLISLPAAAEQDYNAERVHARGYGVRLELATLTEHDLVDAITKVVHDPSYKSRMLLKSKQYKDRPMTPLQTAIWWTELVLRHDDLSYLKTSSIYQSWWRRRSLDIYGIVFLGIALVFLVSMKAIGIVIRLVSAENSTVSNTSKNGKKKTN